MNAALKKTKTTNVLNVNHPDKVSALDAEKYAAMKRAFLRVLPKTGPGLTAEQIRKRVLDYLPSDVFPGGARASWWTKTVQLDLEARGTVVREKCTPLRWRKR